MKLASLRPHVALWGLRAAWALAVALWALALVPWFKTPPPLPSAQRAATGAARGAAASLPGGRAPDEEIAEPREPTAVTPRTVEVAAALPSERVARDGSVCGLGDGGSSDTPSPSQKSSHFARQASLGLQQTFDALRARAELPAQAAGWWLRVVLAREGAADASPVLPPCAPGSDCAAPAAASLPTVATAVDALAQLAQASSDPWVQQIAQRACDGAAPPSAVCVSLGTRRWSAQEPDNAAAWLELAARDPQAVDEALFRAAKANRFDSHRGRLSAWVLQASPEQLPAMQRYAAWQRSDELERAADARVLTAAARACNETARRDANRDQLCDGVARWLTQNSRAPLVAETAASAPSRALDCATIERQWREARDNAQRGARVATSSAATQRP